MEFNFPGYELKFIQRRKINDGSDHLYSYLYSFNSPRTNLKYVLTADLHTHDFFAIKFYPKCYKKTDKKYSLITNKGDLGNILVTCLKVIPTLLHLYPQASFGIAAASTFDNASNKVEQWEQNQRFKLYCYIAPKKIGNETFQHFQYSDVSCYLLVNRSYSMEVDETEAVLRSMLISTYPDFTLF